MQQIINIDSWERKEHFQYFKDFDQPFFSVTVEVDCTKAYQLCQSSGYSFFLYYLFQSLMTVNEIDAFKYRIVNNDVIHYDRIDASPTIHRPNGTFGYAYFEFVESFLQFQKLAKSKIEQVQNNQNLLPATSSENVIHYSSLPWIQFTSLTHASHSIFKDSCPKITFGKMHIVDAKNIMPISISMHHALADGLHVSQFIDAFQSRI